MTRTLPIDRGGDTGWLPGSLRRLFAAGTLCGLTDGQLLERYLRGSRDDAADAEAAFAAIVERHGPMVLDVCRSVLGDRHDAEDACQAAFLVLARRAGSIRRGESVASWLYGVARRVALRARRDAARRRELERRRLERIAVEEPISRTPPEPWPELYEELDRLPEPFRAAIVSCDLEGHTYEQAAGLLGCPVGTIQSRLARGRSRLRRRLERRGITPGLFGIVAGAGLSARAATALPPGLSAVITRAAVGIGSGRTIAAAAPAAVANLAGAEVRRQVMSRMLTIAMTLLVTGMTASAALVLASAWHDGNPQQQQQQTPAVAKTNDPATIHVRVVDLGGKPAPAIVIEARAIDRPTRTFTSGPGGRAAIPRDAIGEWGFLVARRGREAIAWASATDTRPNRPAGTEAAPIVMQLLSVDHRVDGSVVNRQGRSIEGVEMTVDFLDHPTNGMVTGLSSLEPILDRDDTDASGRFALSLPRDAMVSLRAMHPQFVGHHLLVARDKNQLAPLVLEPAGSIAGRVTDAETGRPVAGAIVGAQLIDRTERILGSWGDARADVQGRFLIGGLEPGVYNLLLSVVPGRPDVTAHAVEGVRVRLGATTPAELSAMTGRPLRIAVIDRDTGQPKPGVEVGCYGPAHPRSGAAVAMHKTDDQGRYTFHVPPGEQWLYIADGSVRNRLSKRTVVVPERGDLEPVRLIWRRASSTERMMVMMGGAAPAPPQKAAIQPKAEDVEVQPTQPADLPPLPAAPAAPAAPATRTVTHTIFGNGDGDLAPKIVDPNARTVIGRVLDPQGRPLPGVQVGVAGAAAAVATDRDGLFELANVAAGDVRIYLQRHQGKFQHETIAAGRDRVELTLAPDSYASSDEMVPTGDEPVPADLRDRLTFVDFELKGTDYLGDGPADGGNDLNRLPRGVHKLGATYFKIGEKMVHVEARLRPDLPRAVKGINVRARAGVLHFLHGAQYGGTSDVLIGAYVVHYADGTSVQIPIACGKGLANWWQFPGRRDEPTGARVAWAGTNQTIDLNPGVKIRLFDFAWKNPHPEKEITTLDVLSAVKDCDPFLVGLTLERDR